MAKILPPEYLEEYSLKHSRAFLPMLMWRLPSEHRWDYSNRFEVAISESVLNILGGSLVDQTIGFDSTKDVTWDTEFGLVDVEIKTTAGHSGFIEAGRAGFVPSGLSATASHLYLHLSVDNPNCGDTRVRKIKVRLYSTWSLICAYIEACKNGRDASRLASSAGPGCHGFFVDSFHQHHCYIGDIIGHINDHGDVEFHVDSWSYINASALQELRSIMIGIQKNDPNYNYEHKDFE